MTRQRLGSRRLLAFFLTLGLVIVSRLAQACAVCFGDPESGQTAGANSAVLFLLAVVGAVLGCFACFFFFLRRQALLAQVEESSPTNLAAEAGASLG